MTTAPSARDQRFGALNRLYGQAACDELARLHICVVGLGGVGSWAVEALARSGIGALTLIDWDKVALSNTNRQIHATADTLGQKKHQALKQRIAAINPDCTVHTIDDFLTLRNLHDCLARDYDYVIDAIDSIRFKAGMIHFCKRHKIPLITTGGAGGLTDPSLIRIADLSRTFNDPLAAKVRRRLRDEYGFSRNPRRRFGVECVFSPQQPLYPKADGSVGHEKPGIAGVSLDCRFGYGSAVFVTATFGFIAVSRVIDKCLARRRQRGDRR